MSSPAISTERGLSITLKFPIFRQNGVFGKTGAFSGVMEQANLPQWITKSISECENNPN